MLSRNSASIFGLILISLVGRWLLTADLASSATYSPHDSSLYVTRAAALLEFGHFGEWTERTLIKLPGFSYAIAAFAGLGVPYEIWTLSLWVVSAFVFSISLRGWVGSNWTLAALALFLAFHPIGFDAGFDVFREKFGASLTLLLWAMTAEIIRSPGKVFPWIAYALLFSISRLTREEDRILLLGQGIAMACFLVWMALWDRKRTHSEPGSILRLLQPVVLGMGLVMGMTLVSDSLARWHIRSSYGHGLLHDMNEGEFPTMIAALRSIEGSEFNRHVMLPRTSLEEVARRHEGFAKVLAIYPKPSIDSYSCVRFKVCSEITNGWSVFFLKDAVEFQKFAPTLSLAQAFYADVAKSIREGCALGELRCAPESSGLLRKLSIRWLPYTIEEFFTQFNKLVHPEISLPIFKGDQTNDSEILKAYRSAISSGVPRVERDESFRRVRNWVSAILRPLSSLAVIISLPFVIYICLKSPSETLTSFFALMMVVSYLRLWGLSLAATTMGFLDDRLYFSSHLLHASIGLVGIIWFIQNVIRRTGLSIRLSRRGGLLGISLLASPNAVAEDLLKEVIALQEGNGATSCSGDQLELGALVLISFVALGFISVIGRKWGVFIRS